MPNQNSSLLRQFLRESLRSINENKKTFLTTENEEIEYGSSGHVGVYETVLVELTNIRKQLSKSDRKERDRITRCMESIRDLKKRAYRHGLKTGKIIELIEESED
tara:strand:- start:861 stop:1175 length:315 start_codon:yes stop_codon:yes gene_type:complete